MKYDVIVIGAGQAGLSMGYYLKQLDLSFIILDKNKEIGEVWRNRYDSLSLFTPHRYSSLPGSLLKGNRNTYPTKDEIANYLEDYSRKFTLPVQLETRVERLSKSEKHFKILTNKGIFSSENVVIATGPFQDPFIPSISKAIPKHIYQTHSSQYKNPSQLKDGSVLVVGGGNSGAQIAIETSKKRETFLSVGHKMKFIPQNIGSKSIFWYFDKLGIYRSDIDSMIGKLLRKQDDPIFGFNLKELIKKGKVIRKPRTTSVIDDSVIFEDNSLLKVDNIIWATGYRSDYSWIEITNLFNENGLPNHQRGITPIEGLYFLGLAWQSSRGSALLQGVGEDANYISKHIV